MPKTKAPVKTGVSSQPNPNVAVEKLLKKFTKSARHLNDVACEIILEYGTEAERSGTTTWVVPDVPVHNFLIGKPLFFKDDISSPTSETVRIFETTTTLVTERHGQAKAILSRFITDLRQENRAGYTADGGELSESVRLIRSLSELSNTDLSKKMRGQQTRLVKGSYTFPHAASNLVLILMKRGYRESPASRACLLAMYRALE